MAAKSCLINTDTLGSRLNHLAHHMMIAAIATADEKLAASLSYRVAMRRQSLSLQNILSMMFLAL